MKARRYFSEGVNSIDEARESRFVAHGQHFTDYRSFGEHQARFDDITLANVNGDGFSCEWCLVECPLALDDSSVSRDEFTASDFDFITWANEVDGDRFCLWLGVRMGAQVQAACHGQGDTTYWGRDGHAGRK